MQFERVWCGKWVDGSPLREKKILLTLKCTKEWIVLCFVVLHCHCNYITLPLFDSWIVENFAFYAFFIHATIKPVFNMLVFKALHWANTTDKWEKNEYIFIYKEKNIEKQKQNEENLQEITSTATLMNKSKCNNTNN